ncbi:hypothetical protein HY086_05145 [Candidatus Gottesmanbacteria bacterium]|nr:hypothetical protein [Candidatus Gottesmanbacteria bacterium]
MQAAKGLETVILTIALGGSGAKALRDARITGAHVVGLIDAKGEEEKATIDPLAHKLALDGGHTMETLKEFHARNSLYAERNGWLEFSSNTLEEGMGA